MENIYTHSLSFIGLLFKHHTGLMTVNLCQLSLNFRSNQEKCQTIIMGLDTCCPTELSTVLTIFYICTIPYGSC